MIHGQPKSCGTQREFFHSFLKIFLLSTFPLTHCLDQMYFQFLYIAYFGRFISRPSALFCSFFFFFTKTPSFCQAIEKKGLKGSLDGQTK